MVLDLLLNFEPIVGQLKSAVDLLKAIWEAYQSLKANKLQVARLLERSFRLVETIESLSTQNEVPSHLKRHLDAFSHILSDLDRFVRKFNKQHQLKLLINRKGITAELVGFDARLSQIATDMNLAVEVNVREWHQQNVQDKQSDEANFKALLESELQLHGNQLMERFEIHGQQFLEAIQALERKMHQDFANEIEKKITTKLLGELRSRSDPNVKVEVQPWSLSSWEIEEDGDIPIATGGYGEIYSGI
ncbi:hypothetical protein BKA69DRAFT_300439 [Paraphysoderma sedebokerense]|nr:hypothetical protein BKA69DRAFT_300439 [Paraphysoderma sedebokerense]